MTTPVVTDKPVQSTFIGSISRGAFKIASATTLAVAGTGLMVTGIYGAYLTSIKVNGFFFAEGEAAKGFGDVPGFNKTCSWSCEKLNIQFNLPELGEEGALPPFCESIGSKAFNQQGSYGPAALATAIGTSSLSYIASLYAFLGGASLIGQSVEVFSSIL